MYDDLSTEELILLAIDHIAKGTDIPADLLSKLPEDVKEVLCP